MSVFFADIDEILGPSSGRYFGDGYRAVEARVRSIGLGAAGVQAVGDLKYPRNWSSRAGRARTDLHLSSLDAISLSFRLIEAMSNPSLTGHQSVKRLSMRAGSSPSHSITDIDMHAETLGLEPPIFRTSVLPFSMEVELTPGPTNAMGPERSAGSEPDWWRPISSTAVRLHDLTLDASHESLEAQGTWHQSSYRVPGIGSRFPAPSIVDTIASAGALAQALLYSLDGISREQAGNFWLRRATINFSQPPATAAEDEAWRACVSRRSVVTVAESPFVSARVSLVSSSGANMLADVAYARGAGDSP
ncbi:AvrD family protein [Humibacter ginsenosidimutans]|uniref:AvrD family protein n=1 Tax=Humibacter ginsenosidimutans TaxID=2599293 RepID=UPI00143CD782|nr:AvrD family protein [Humibacter ginsenosidimutans]